MSWVDDVINEGEEALKSSDRKTMESFLRYATKRMEYEDVPSPKRGLNFFKQRMTIIGFGGRYSVTPPEPNEEDIKSDVHTIIDKLKDWKEMMDDPTSKAGKHYIKNHNININNNSLNAQANSTSSSSVQIDLSITIEAIESSDLDEDQIKELKALMLDLSASKGKDAKTIAEKLKDALDVAKSSAGAAKAVMEFAIPIIQSIL